MVDHIESLSKGNPHGFAAFFSGWCFGCHQFPMFPINIGLLSSYQLTHIFQRGGLKPPTSFCMFSQKGKPWTRPRQSHLARDREPRGREARAEAIRPGAYGGTEPW